ncbi:hypothetical protein [Paenibacillus glucanolyticus]|uniref:hypothetical protein n=1 Tax=Paenibacillus glucanolyticus TaxID=59843 RepID=UPI0034CD7F70
MIDLSIIKIPRLLNDRMLIPTCFDDSIATITTSFQRDYPFMYLHSWGFPYKESTKCISESFNWTDKKLECLRIYHGVVGEKVYVANGLESAIGRIEKALNNGISVLVSVSCFWTSWDKNYQIRDDIAHNFILTKVNLAENVFYGIDPYYNLTKVEIEKENLEKGLQTAVFFQLEDTYTNDALEFKNTLLQYLEMKLIEDSEEGGNGIKQFSKDILLKEMTEIDAQRLPFLMNKITSSRMEFAILLQYMSKKSKEGLFHTVAENVILIAQQWNIVCALFMKYFVVKDNRVLKKIVDKIEEINELENQTSRQLIDKLLL